MTNAGNTKILNHINIEHTFSLTKSASAACHTNSSLNHVLIQLIKYDSHMFIVVTNSSCHLSKYSQSQRNVALSTAEFIHKWHQIFPNFQTVGISVQKSTSCN